MLGSRNWIPSSSTRPRRSVLGTWAEGPEGHPSKDLICLLMRLCFAESSETYCRTYSDGGGPAIYALGTERCGVAGPEAYPLGGQKDPQNMI